MLKFGSRSQVLGSFAHKIALGGFFSSLSSVMALLSSSLQPVGVSTIQHRPASRLAYKYKLAVETIQLNTNLSMCYIFCSIKINKENPLCQCPPGTVRYNQANLGLLCRHVRRKISASVDGGSSGGSRLRRPGSKDPHWH